MHQGSSLRVPFVLLVVMVLVVAACGAGASPSPSSAAPSTPASVAPGSDAPSEEPSPSELAGSKNFTVAFTSIGLSSVALLAAIDELKTQGYTIDTPEVADNNLIVQGVSTGEFQFSSGTTLAVMIAAKTGAPVKIIGNRIGNEWTVASVATIADCAGLNGKRYAHHSEAAVSTAMGRNWVAESCPGTTPEEVIIAGSDNRANALIADQIDATELELSDTISLLASQGDKFHVLTSFSETLPDLKPSTIYGNSEYMAENPGDVVALLTAVLAENQKISEDADYLKELAIKYLPNVNQDTLDEVAAQYVELGLFEPDGGVTAEQLEYTIGFFEDAQALEAGLTVDQVADLSFLEMALGM
jgi:NitT/TauT family transport system substrate-binding protein